MRHLRPGRQAVELLEEPPSGPRILLARALGRQPPRALFLLAVRAVNDLEAF